MFTSDHIAPCGLDCALCVYAQDHDAPCPGCNGAGGNKPAFCREHCGIIRCEKRVQKGYRYCDACPDFPCGEIRERETRYQTAYPLAESPIDNLRFLGERGMAALLERERQRWACPQCGGVVSVHTGKCGNCGRKHPDAK